MVYLCWVSPWELSALRKAIRHLPFGGALHVFKTCYLEQMSSLSTRWCFLETVVGPVILKPELTAIEGTKAQKQALLIGIVHSYLPYEEIAISLQTHKERIRFQKTRGSH